MVEYAYWDFESNPISEDQYRKFIHEYYGDLAETHYERVKWYKKRGRYCILLAICDGNVAGQSCAYEVDADCLGTDIVLWWSIDTFVLPEFRGKGIGKGLQKKLHEEYENFSSLWYSRENGNIKRRCGAKELLHVHTNYYPVSSFFFVLFKVIAKRTLKKTINTPIFLRNTFFYTRVNSIFDRSKKYSVKDVNLTDRLELWIPYIEKVSKKHDFHIHRDYEYMLWKYMNNPSLKEYHTLLFYSLSNPEELLGLIVFSGIFEKQVFSVPLKVVTVLDCFIINETELSKSSILLEVGKYFSHKKVILDGILSLEDFPFYPFLRYPYKGSPFLSTYANEEPITHSYLSYSDQDMEQMVY